MKKPFLASLIRSFFRRKRKLRARIARKLLQLSGQTRVADSAKISHLARFDLAWNSKRDVVLSIGKRSNIKEYAILAPREGFIHIGEDCSINPFCVLLGYGGITIGNKVRIAAHGAIIAFNHNFDDPNVSILEQGNNFKGIRIEDGAWLGNNVKVLDGVTIGRGAVVGAGSVVTKSVPPMAVVAGVPAKVIKMRASEADLSDLPE